jgi:CRP-like cAMP-binding protein
MLTALIAKLERTIRLTADDKRAISLAAFSRKSIPARQDLCREREPSQGFFVVLEGLLARFRSLQSGKRQIVGYALPGDVLDTSDGRESIATYGLCTLAPSTVARISEDDFAALMAGSPRIAKGVWRAQGEQFSIACEWLLNVGQRNAEQRIAHLFCEQYYRLRAVGQARDKSFAFPLTQRDLADSVGLTNVHVNRVLQALRHEKLVTFDSGAVTILDLDALVEKAEFDPHYLHLSAA